MATIKAGPIQNQYVDFHIVYKVHQESKEADIFKVKTYGKVVGKILTFFGFASKVDIQGNKYLYVNRKVFLEHLTEAWLRQRPDIQPVNKKNFIKCFAKEMPKNSTLEHPEKDIGLKKITAAKTEELFHRCTGHWIVKYKLKL